MDSDNNKRGRFTRSGLFNPLWFSVMFVLLSLAPASLNAQTTLYWDLRGGSGAGATPTGTWDTTTSNWNTTVAGTGATGTYTSGSTAVFSAGTDAVNAYTVTVSGTQNTAGITIEDGTPAFTGGTINFSDATPTLDINTSRTLNWGSTAITSSTGALDINTSGSSTGIINFTQNLSFSGTVNLGGGTLRLTSATLGLTTLNITGSSTIDFAGTSSTLDLTYLTIANGVTLTINNWANGSDLFKTQNFAGVTPNTADSGALSQISFTGFSATSDKWLSYDKQISPVPEPSTYGSMLLLVTAGILGYRRCRRGAA